MGRIPIRSPVQAQVKHAEMKQSIVKFHQDEYGDWVADLACGHGQHVRHKPPMTVRPWVLTEQGRQGHLGQLLDCKKCDGEG